MLLIRSKTKFGDADLLNSNRCDWPHAPTLASVNKRLAATRISNLVQVNRQELWVFKVRKSVLKKLFPFVLVPGSS
jgi:hypothetical protein